MRREKGRMRMVENEDGEDDEDEEEKQDDNEEDGAVFA
jgi:hypothetical protein